MNKQTYDALPALGPSQLRPCKTPLLDMARFYRDRASRCYSSGSGADVADAPMYDLAADFFGAAANGKDAYAVCDAAWRQYAAERQLRVAKAPKVRRGPSSGHSVIAHRWVSPDAFDHLISSFYVAHAMQEEKS